MASVSKQLISCMKKAKTNAQRAACKKSFAKKVPPKTGPFQNITKYQQAKQDSAGFPGYDKDNIFYQAPDFWEKRNKKKKK